MSKLPAGDQICDDLPDAACAEPPRVWADLEGSHHLGLGRLARRCGTGTRLVCLSGQPDCGHEIYRPHLLLRLSYCSADLAHPRKYDSAPLTGNHEQLTRLLSVADSQIIVTRLKYTFLYLSGLMVRSTTNVHMWLRLSLMYASSIRQPARVRLLFGFSMTRTVHALYYAPRDISLFFNQCWLIGRHSHCRKALQPVNQCHCPAAHGPCSNCLSLRNFHNTHMLHRYLRSLHIMIICYLLADAAR